MQWDLVKKKKKKGWARSLWAAGSSSQHVLGVVSPWPVLVLPHQPGDIRQPEENPGPNPAWFQGSAASGTSRTLSQVAVRVDSCKGLGSAGSL